MRGTAEWLLGQFPDLSMTIESIVADEDMVAVRVRSTGTNSGKLNGFLPPSGKRFTSEQSHWFRIEDGKLAEHWATRDDLSSMLQLGVVTPPRLGALVRQVSDDRALSLVAEVDGRLVGWLSARLELPHHNADPKNGPQPGARQ